MSSLADALTIREADSNSMLDPQLLEVSKQMIEMQSNLPDFQNELEVDDSEKDNATESVKEEEMADLFGDEDAEVVARGSLAASPDPSTGSLSATEQQRRKDLEYEEDERAEEAVVELKHAVLSIPNIPAPTSSDGESWVIRMPNFVKLDPKPFHSDTYVGPDQGDDDGLLDAARERSMSIKLEVENTIRWRWLKDDIGQNRRQSNSRIIRWSDGSLSLLLGKEIFDLNQTIDNSASTPRQYSASQSAQTQPTPTTKSHGLTYLVAQHKRPGILQVEAPITGYMSVRPTGMQSETHRKLVRAVGQKHNKIARLRMAPDPTTDPEREKMELMKQAAKKGKKTREDDGFGSRRRRSAVSRRRVNESVWSDDEEPAVGFDASDDDEDEDLRGNRKAKREQPNSVGKRGAGEYQTDDFVVADSSDEGAEGSDTGGTRKRRRSDEQEDQVQGPMDDLDEADAKIEQQERERRRNQQQQAVRAEAEEVEQPTTENTGTQAMDVDVESEEEDEEEFRIRRTATGSRKKRAISMDDEEE